MSGALTFKLETGTVLPFKWAPYPYQARALTRYFGADGAPPQTRQIHVWSRRLGKDRFGMELAALASQFRVMNIWHLFPLHKQARIAIWNGVDPMSGARFLDQTFPPDMIARRSDAQMMLEFYNGSTYQMLGSDNYNSVVGANPGLVLFSEFALSDPLAWTYISPIIRQNGGGAIFISTYRGKNHHYKLAQQVAKDPEWYVSTEDVTTAVKDDGTPVYPRSEAEKELVHMPMHRWREEFLNIPSAALEGAYFGNEMQEAHEEGRSGKNPLLELGAPLGCAWSWAHNHHVWAVLFQVREAKVYIVGARHWQFTDPARSLEELEALNEKIDCHVIPADSLEGVPGETIAERFDVCISANVYICADIDAAAGIDTARRLIPCVNFGTDEGVPEYVEALSQFRSGASRIDEDNLNVATTPVRDSGAVAAAALMQLADFKASGEELRRDTVPLDWSKRNARRRLA